MTQNLTDSFRKHVLEQGAFRPLFPAIRQGNLAEVAKGMWEAKIIVEAEKLDLFTRSLSRIGAQDRGRIMALFPLSFLADNVTRPMIDDLITKLQIPPENRPAEVTCYGLPWCVLVDSVVEKLPGKTAKQKARGLYNLVVVTYDPSRLSPFDRFLQGILTPCPTSAPI